MLKAKEKKVLTVAPSLIVLAKDRLHNQDYQTFCHIYWHMTDLEAKLYKPTGCVNKCGVQLQSLVLEYEKLTQEGGQGWP